MRLKQLQPKSGFTTGFSLLELLIYVSILSVIMIIISNTFISISRGSGQSEAKSEVNSAIRFAAELLKQDIKNASVITIPISGTSASLSLTRGGTSVVYDVASGVLRRKEGAADPVSVTNPNILVSTPVFSRIENTNTTLNDTNVTIKINITFNYNSTSSDWFYSNSLQTSVGMY